MKKIVVACGSGIATSTAVEAKVKDLLDNNGLSGQYTITKCAIGEAPSQCTDADLLVATTAAPAGISCPYVSGVPFLTTLRPSSRSSRLSSSSDRRSGDIAGRLSGGSLRSPHCGPIPFCPQRDAPVPKAPWGHGVPWFVFCKRK